MKPTKATTGQATARPWHVQDEGSQLIIASQRESRPEAPVSICRMYAPQNKMAQINAALIVTAVNEHDALKAVAEAAKPFTILNRLHCPSFAGSIDNLEQALANLAAIRNGIDKR